MFLYNRTRGAHYVIFGFYHYIFKPYGGIAKVSDDSLTINNNIALSFSTIGFVYPPR